MLTKLIGRCLQCSIQEDQERLNEQVKDSPRKRQGISSEELHFIIPSCDFLNYEFRKPEPGPELSVGEYMYFYRYVTTKNNFKQPGPDHRWVLYFFRDRGCIHLLKGWVPTSSGYEIYKQHEKVLLASITGKAELPNSGRCDENNALRLKNNELKKAIVNELESKDRVQSPLVNLCSLQRKSACNWGVNSSWSRHLASGSYDNVPFQVASPVYSSASMDQLTKEIHAVIDGKSLKQICPMRGRRIQGMVTSTIDTRDRKVRPGAAKGSRKPPILSSQFKSF